MTEYRQCVRCLMDTTTKHISFDENGICGYCHDYAAFEARNPLETIYSQERLSAQLAEIKEEGKDKKYDCILGISGGVDSSYLCHFLKKMEMRPLLVHFDNHWNTQIAENNIAALVKGTGFDYYRYAVDWDEFREHQRAYFKSSVLDVEVLTDHAAFAVLFEQAKKHDIRHVMVGQNYTTEFAMPRDWNYSKSDLANIHAILAKYSAAPLRLMPTYDIAETKKYFVTVEPLQHVNFIKDKAIDTLKKLYGWQPYPYKHYESLITWFYQAYYLPQKYGIDKRKVHLSNLIWSRQISREKALEEIEKPLVPKESKYLIAEVVRKLGFSPAEWKAVMTARPVPHEAFAHAPRR